MQIEDYLIDPAGIATGWAREMKPFGFIDLDSAPLDFGAADLPVFPVIGIGDSSHPLARQLDAIVESPITPDILMRSISANPRTAAVAVHLLRTIESMDVEPALVQESVAYGLLQGSAEHAAWSVSRVPSGGSASEGRVQLTRDADVLDILLDRAEERNAVDRTMRDALYEAFTLAALDPDISKVRLRGAGRAFSVGADLAEFGTTRDPATAHLIRMLTLPAHAIVKCSAKFEAHIQGACVGSALEMTAFARRLTASANAWFHLPELAMGVIPGAGGCVSVSRRIGRQRAALMILSSRRINAATALDWGLIDAIVDDNAIDESAANVRR